MFNEFTCRESWEPYEHQKTYAEFILIKLALISSIIVTLP